MTTIPSNVQGYKVVGVKFNEESKGVHQLLWKQHSVRIQNSFKPSDRTLFVLNVPPYCTKISFKKMFSKFGKVDRVFFHKKPNSGCHPLVKYPHFSSIPPVLGFKMAYVVFMQPSSIKAAMNVPNNTVLVASTLQQPIFTGVKKWQIQYNSMFVDRVKLSEEIKQVMEAYDQKREAEKKVGKQAPDDEGWTTITSQKKKKPKLQKTGDVKMKNKKNNKKKKKQELVNFYAFQHRQAKMDHLAQLRKKFEEDKKRITVMRAARKFSPY